MNPSQLDILWILLAASLVFLMQAGFMCLESGLTRSKNSINVAIKNLADFCFSVCSYWAVGYGLMFGASQFGLIGGDHFFVSLDSGAFLVAFFFFQAMFCGTATTIFSGAVAERMRFSSYMIVAGVLSLLVYPIYGHWAWAGLDTGEMSGWLGQAGFVDFAGSTVVHSVGGWVALAALLVIGPRNGRFQKDGTVHEMNASNLPMSVLGAFLLWFGWFGFNGGSTLAMNESVAFIIAKTTLAGAASAASCMLLGWVRGGQPKVAYLINGALGGLVAITANCHVVSSIDAFLIGLAAGPVCLYADELLLKLRIDDAVSAVPVHLACGIWGTLAVALFGDPELLGTGLSFGGQLWVQAQGVFMAFVIAFLLPLLLLRGIDRVWPLRVTDEEEDIGLNVSEHGAKTDLVDLFAAMDKQAETHDLSLRMPEEPFTEVGHIARRYNQVMDALEQAMQHTEAIVKSAAEAIVTFARDTGEILSVNPTAVNMFGYQLSTPEGYVVTDLFQPEEQERVQASLLSGETVELTARRMDGAPFPVEAVVSRAGVDESSFFVGMFRDISERREAEEALATQKAYLEQLFEGSPQAIVLVDLKGDIVASNQGYFDLFGHKAADVKGRKNRHLIVPKDLTTEAVSVAKTAMLGRPVVRETRRLHKNGREIPVNLVGYPIMINNKTLGVYYIYSDISERKAYEEQLSHQAFHDGLTGLPNRMLFSERLNRAINRSQRNESYSFAAMLMDLDRFKYVNDTLGHLAGDEVLIEVSKRVSSCIRNVDTLARLGGDEFAILLEEFHSAREVIDVAKRIMTVVEKPIDLDGNEFNTSASIGIVITTKYYDNPDDILRDADIAMYRAKDLGKARFKVFNKKMHELVVEEIQLETELRNGFQEDEFELYYQPIMDVDGETLSGFEALIRWNSPTRGVVSPDRFIPLAEDTGLIIPLGQWIIKSACCQLGEWRREFEHMDGLTMNINLSSKQFLQTDLIEFVRNVLKDCDLEAKYLKFEITESVVMQDAKAAVGALNKLKEMGVQIAIDDFGTGYSSLSYLQKFPIDVLKIDRSFISGEGDGEDKLEIVKTIISMAKNLGVSVVAEGVENEKQLELLREYDCSNAQGYLFSKPMQSEQARAFIKELAPDAGDE